MKKVSGRKMFVFAILSVVYATLAAFVLTMAAIHVCSMQPDVAATCDPTPINIVLALLAVTYLGLAVIFFRSRISGVD